MIVDVKAADRAAVDVQDVHRLARRVTEGVRPTVLVTRRVGVVHRGALVHRQRPADRPLPIHHHPAQRQRAGVHRRPARVVDVLTAQRQVGRAVLDQAQGPGAAPGIIAEDTVVASVRGLVHRQHRVARGGPHLRILDVGDSCVAAHVQVSDRLVKAHQIERPVSQRGGRRPKGHVHVRAQLVGRTHPQDAVGVVGTAAPDHHLPALPVKEGRPIRVGQHRHALPLGEGSGEGVLTT